MTQLQLGIGAYQRDFGREPNVQLENRFLENDPTNLIDNVALLSRPGSKFRNGIGAGPIRANYTQRGTFSNDLFVVSGEALYRLNDDGTKIVIAGTVSLLGDPQMVIVAGTGFEHLWITDGILLQYYTGPSAASGTLTYTAGAILDDVVLIDTINYKFSVDPLSDPLANGSVANPWQVDVGATDVDSLSNLQKAINATGVASIDYSTALTIHPSVTSDALSATTVGAKAKVAGIVGNTIITTITTTGGADGLAWGAGTLLNGGNHSLKGATIPSGKGAVALDALVQFVIVSTAEEDRFYYVQPGAVIVQALDFATAERQADKVVDVVTVGSQVWLVGETTLEPWYPTGNAANPFAPIQGRTLSRGALLGTPIRVNETLVLVGDDDRVYTVAGSPVPISTHGIEERIRVARRLIKEAGL